MRARLARLLASDGRCLDVAIDHGIFNTPGFLGGIENMARAVDTIVEAGPDAVQLAPGQVGLLQDRSGPKPALVYRADVANVYGPNPPPELFCELISNPVERAVQADAACLVIFMLSISDQTELHRQCVQNLCDVKPECERLGMPLMVEPIAMRPDGAGGYAVEGDADTIVHLVRQSVELGADVLKVDPTRDLAEYPRVIETAGDRPVLVRGGGKASEEVIFRRTVEVMATGAAGIVYGRNIIQHEKPSAITRAFMAIVHDGADVSRAMEILRDG